jgi:hypothetical protein
MTKNEFIKQYEISEAVPIDPSKKALPAEAFSSAITEFLEARFSGAVRVECDRISAQSILVCAEYVAFFLKRLLTDVYGRVLLTVNLKSDTDGLHIIISADEDLPLTESEIRELIRHARNGGFNVMVYSNAIALSVGFSPASVRRVYAVSIYDGKRIMLGKLVEIFYQGELMNADPKPLPQTPEPIKKKSTKKK